MVQNITTKEFKEKISEGKVLVDFYATWCGPCKMLSPLVDELSEELNNVKFYKVDVDEEEILASEFNVESIPTLLLFENGKLVKRQVGFLPKNALKGFIGE